MLALSGFISGHYLIRISHLSPIHFFSYIPHLKWVGQRDFNGHNASTSHLLSAVIIAVLFS